MHRADGRGGDSSGDKEAAQVRGSTGQCNEPTLPAVSLKALKHAFHEHKVLIMKPQHPDPHQAL